jgi:carboxymethylenebutenolidase
MTIATEWVEYGGKQVGYLARPVSPPGAGAAEPLSRPLPGVIVLQEIWGVDAHIQDVTRRFAAAGYAALAPDLYAVNGARPAALTEKRVRATQLFVETLPRPAMFDPSARAAGLATRPETERHEIEETFQALFASVMSGGLKLEVWIPSVAAAAAYLRAGASQGQKVATVGFCMGGGLSALYACTDPELAAAVVFYGNAPSAEQLQGIACPVLGLYGSLDERVNAGLPAFAAAMKGAGKAFDHHLYDGAEHAFFNDNRASYHPAAARDAFVRTLDLFRRQLA